ncbi:HupE/UreJ family protein [Aurantiacibacter sp. MUD11]|uniref:HupE/UreJ family protein n=1 Tax=Aurantiacibacter sp. MUD11 TaxID=3003265 RepID=UPI0022AA0928|nr:HupE/UreJ family protein [Aurantiacibacter sp. MUD11]WAT17910.1 HupE/UreJ family protein [Aurantiacibacter sp. MUD11]
MLPASASRSWLALLLALVANAVLASIPAAAHDARPVSVQIRELPGERYALHVRTPGSVAADNLPRLLPPANCMPVTIGTEDGQSEASAMVVSCPGGIEGQEFRLTFPIYNPSLSTLYRFERLDAAPLSALVAPSEGGWIVPQAPSALEIAGDYFRLGMEHIFGGIDHLLFVVGLLAIAGTWRRSLLALTGFTLAHSVTLALSALDLVRLPVAPVEAVIALSILFLAVEIVRADRNSLTYRYPTLVASTFGLVHGFGFASVLREIGVPGDEIVVALLSFNLGVEVGQVIFVGVCLALVAAARKLLRHTAIPGAGERFGLVRSFAAYMLGTVSVFWLMDRVAGFA